LLINVDDRLVHAGVSVEGVRDTIRIHKERKELRNKHLDA